jgi:hypothetical protein
LKGLLSKVVLCQDCTLSIEPDYDRHVIDDGAGHNEYFLNANFEEARHLKGQAEGRIITLVFNGIDGYPGDTQLFASCSWVRSCMAW